MKKKMLGAGLCRLFTGYRGCQVRRRKNKRRLRD
jgi:hypothetical protein